MDTKEKVQGGPAGHAKKQTRQEKPSKPLKKKKNTSAQPAQEVIFEAPKPFIRNRILMRLATVAAVVLALVLAISIFFRVQYFEVSGMEQYTAWDISEASGIEEGDSLFSLKLPGAAARIKELPYVKDVRIGIRLPNKVIIHITEVRVTYAIKGEHGEWWLVDSAGQVVQQAEQGTEANYTKILGVHVKDPKVGSIVTALETDNPSLDENGNTVPGSVTADQKLSTALTIADCLENNGIIGQAASIDVNDLGDIQFWYGSQYQVKLGNDQNLTSKIAMIKGTIDQLNKETHNSGVLKCYREGENIKVQYSPFQ